MTKYNFTQEDISNVIKYYQDGLSVAKVADKMNVSYGVVRYALERNGIKQRPRKKYNINEQYFDKIDTPNKAYIVGLLYSDGANTSNYETEHYCVSIMLQKRDVKLLEDIKTEMESDAPITAYAIETRGVKREYYRFNICNKHIAYRMMELGVCPNKTFKVTFPEWLSEDLYPHFIRGLSDGDGYICTHKRHIQATLTGTTSLCQSVSMIVSKMCDIFAPVHSIGKDRNEEIKTMHVSGRLQVIRYLDYIYKDANIKLGRKYEKYLELSA